MTLADDKGHRVFADEDWEDILSMDSIFLNEMAEAACKLNLVRKSDVEDLKKN